MVGKGMLPERRRKGRENGSRRFLICGDEIDAVESDSTSDDGLRWQGGGFRRSGRGMRSDGVGDLEEYSDLLRQEDEGDGLWKGESKIDRRFLLSGVWHGDRATGSNGENDFFIAEMTDLTVVVGRKWDRGRFVVGRLILVQ